jgi:hypothetical protein
MAIHFVVLLFVVVVACLWTPENSRRLSICCALIFFSLIAFRNGGSVDDHSVYESTFKIFSNHRHFVDWIELYTQLEIFVALLFGWSVKGFYFLSALTSACFLGISLPYFIKKRNEFVIYWIGLALLHYFSCTGVIIQVQCAAMLMYNITLQLRGKKVFSFIFYFLMCLVHSAAIMMLPLWFMIQYRNKIFNQNRLRYWPYLMLIFSLLGGVKFLILRCSDYIPGEYQYIVEIIMNGESADKKGFLIFFCLFCYSITLFKVKLKNCDRFKKSALIAVFAYLSLYFSSFGVLFLVRIAYYLLFLSPFCFAYVPLHKFEKAMLGVFMSAYFAYTMFHFDTPVISDYQGNIDLSEQYTSASN